MTDQLTEVDMLPAVDLTPEQEVLVIELHGLLLKQPTAAARFIVHLRDRVAELEHDIERAIGNHAADLNPKGRSLSVGDRLVYTNTYGSARFSRGEYLATLVSKRVNGQYLIRIDGERLPITVGEKRLRLATEVDVEKLSENPEEP